MRFSVPSPSDVPFTPFTPLSADRAPAGTMRSVVGVVAAAICPPL
ncbi:MAG: hypothetical protein ABSG86_11325 [Thermoguttaceae bacterium]